MASAFIELPESLELHDGESAEFNIQIISMDGRLVARRVMPLAHQGVVNQDRQSAVDHFVTKWKGALSGMTDAEIDDDRYEYLTAKHLR